VIGTGCSGSVTSTDKIGDEYWSFEIGDELNDKYRLEVSGYSGDSGDSLQYEGDLNGNGLFDAYNHDEMKFTTSDQDNDENDSQNCAVSRGGGWWYNRCMMTCLTCKASRHEMYTLPVVSRLINSRMVIKPQ